MINKKAIENNNRLQVKRRPPMPQPAHKEDAPLKSSAQETTTFGSLPELPTTRRLRQQNVLQLQHTHGNAYVQQLLQQRRALGNITTNTTGKNGYLQREKSRKKKIKLTKNQRRQQRQIAINAIDNYLDALWQARSQQFGNELLALNRFETAAGPSNKSNFQLVARHIQGEVLELIPYIGEWIELGTDIYDDYRDNRINITASKLKRDLLDKMRGNKKSATAFQQKEYKRMIKSYDAFTEDTDLVEFVDAVQTRTADVRKNPAGALKRKGGKKAPSENAILKELIRGWLTGSNHWFVQCYEWYVKTEETSQGPGNTTKTRTKLKATRLYYSKSTLLNNRHWDMESELNTLGIWKLNKKGEPGVKNSKIRTEFPGAKLGIRDFAEYKVCAPGDDCTDYGQ